MTGLTRATLVAAIREFLIATYRGPVAILPETSIEETSPPYAVIRIGSGEQLYPGIAEIWDMTVLIGVFHDADVTSPETAEAQAGEVFAMFDDPDGLYTHSAETLAWSALEHVTTDASIVENRWQHVAGFRAIVAPAAEN